jgi:hypothetical protein
MLNSNLMWTSNTFSIALALHVESPTIRKLLKVVFDAACELSIKEENVDWHK